AHRDLFASFAVESPEWTTVIANGQPVWAQVEQVSANYFDVLGVKPAIGQGLRPTDADHPEGAGALLGYAMWRRVYGGATPVTRLTITVDDRTYPVMGVMPPEMDGQGAGNTSSLAWVQIPRSGEERAEGIPFFVWALIRPKPGQDTALMARQLAAIAKPFADAFGNWGGNSLRYDLGSQVPRPGKITEIHKALAAAAFVVLLIACANVANLLVARVIGRQRDIAVRMAVGASGYDVARYVVGEAAVLAAVGGAGGVLLSLWGMHFIEYQIGADVTGLSGLVPHLSWRVLLFSIAMSAGTVLLIAWGAVLRARRTNVNDAMKNGTAATTHRSGRVYRWLVVTELAMSLVVLMGAALLLRAVSAVRGFQFGYDPQRVVFANIQDPWPALHDSVAREARFAGILAGVREIRGVRAAAWRNSAAPEGEILTSDLGGAEPRQLFMRSYMVASPGLLPLLGVKITEGRDFEAGDAASRGVAIVDDSTAAALWPHVSPIGHLVKLGTEAGNAPWVRVIGVARTVSLRFEHDPDMGPLPTMYVAGAGRLGNGRQLVIRTDRAEGAAMLGVLRYLRGVLPGPNQPHFQSWTEDFGLEVRERQSVAFLFQMIGLFALVLSTIGVYGTLAYTGAQRTREFAMRIALGAQSRDVWRLVVDEALLLVLGGTAVGAFAAMWAAASIERLLYTVSPVDAVALVT
ncbi:MAG: ABC transporter permease, partial [Gemmatimonadota bacterium]|nr:ABC transporter permease [Gemmatimonadota bacterium]